MSRCKLTYLEELQAASRKRNAEKLNKSAINGKDMKILDLKSKPVVQKEEKVKDEKPDSQVDYRKVSAFAGSVKDEIDSKKFVRPASVYSNKSPYGIATELLNGKI